MLHRSVGRLEREGRGIAKPSELKPRKPPGSSSSHSSNSWVLFKIQSGEVVVLNGKFDTRSGQRTNGAHRETVLGKLVKTISTSRHRDNIRAAQIVEAELERMRGESRNPNLKAIQLTTGDSLTGKYSATYAIYGPLSASSKP